MTNPLTKPLLTQTETIDTATFNAERVEVRPLPDAENDNLILLPESVLVRRRRRARCRMSR